MDDIGLSVYCFPEADLKYKGHVLTFPEQMDEKYARVGQFGKPVVIAEFGVCGSEEEKTNYLTGALSQLKNYPLLTTVVFFIASDTPGCWGKDVYKAA